jgi:hypothetical protein
VTDDTEYNLSLDDLVGESDTHWEDVMTEHEKWSNTKYPYDNAECCYCATQHDNILPFHARCVWPSHEEMRKEASELQLATMNEQDSPEFRSIVLKFREKYARFYAPRG